MITISFVSEIEYDDIFVYGQQNKTSSKKLETISNSDMTFVVNENNELKSISFKGFETHPHPETLISLIGKYLNEQRLEKLLK